MLQTLTANLSGKIRKETLNGREYLVAPLSMIVPGVLNGSKGPLYYPLNEIQRSSDAWNGMPIVVNHPTADGHACSARTPEVIKNSGVGTVFNATTANGKLSAEGWFDILKTKELSPSTYSKLLKNEPEELSTGLFTDNEPIGNDEEAEFNGRKYTHIARNYRPDHLAILPGKKGACSIEDGCGVNVNEEQEVGNSGGSDNDCDGGGWGTRNATGQSQNEEPTEDQLDQHLDFDAVDNRASFNDIRSSVWQALRERFGMEVSIVDLFPDMVVFHRDDKLVQLDYTVDDETYEATLSDMAPTEVRRVTEYKAVENEACNCGPDCDCEPCRNKHWYKLVNSGSVAWHELIENRAIDVSPEKACKILEDGEVNGKPLTKAQRGMFGAICGKKPVKNVEAQMPLTQEQKEKIVSDLIANTVGPNPWEEGDKEALLSLPDDKLVAMNEQRELLVNGSDGLFKKKDEEEEDKEKMAKNQEAPVVNTKPKTAQEWLAEAPPEIRSAVNNAMDFERRQKESLIKQITKNDRNPFSKDWLNSKPLEELQGLAALAANQGDDQQQETPMFAPHYAGVPGPGMVQNLGEDFINEDQDMIPEPFDWNG